MSVNRITVLGGTGFVGTNLVAKLANMANEVCVLTRRKKRFGSLRVLSNVSVIEIDVHDAIALQQAVSGSDVVINLVGILNQGGNDGKKLFSRSARRIDPSGG